MRKGLFALCELYPLAASWYMWVMQGTFVAMFREHEIIGPYNAQTMEHKQQEVQLGCKHSNGGGNIGRMTNQVRDNPALKPAYMERRAAGQRSFEESLFRRLVGFEFRRRAYPSLL